MSKNYEIIKEMEKSKILVVEDNIITAKHITNSLKKFGHTITDMVNSKKTVEKSIVSNRPDLVILDINLGQEIDGIQIAGILENDYSIPFVFLTSYNDEETISRILKLNPSGYIIKPFNPVDLNSVVELALFKARSGKQKVKMPEEVKSGSASTSLDEFLFVKNGRNIDRIPVAEIDFIQADGRYTYIHVNGVKKISNTPLKSLRDKLSRANFVQTHKSFIVNLTMVDTITLHLLLIGDYEIPISKNYRSDLLAGLEIV